MKKIICIAVLCLVCALSFYGCSGKSEDKSNTNMNMVIGKIEAIDGKKITLAVADVESMFGGERPTGDFSNFNGEMPEDFNPENFDGEMPENFNPEDFGGERPSFPEGEMPENFNPEDFGGERPDRGERPENGEMPEGFNPQMGGMMNFDVSALTFSGETEEYTVPEGMKIGDGDYTSLKVGNVIMMTFDQEGGIGEIRVMPTQAVTDEQVTE